MERRAGTGAWAIVPLTLHAPQRRGAPRARAPACRWRPAGTRAWRWCCSAGAARTEWRCGRGPRSPPCRRSQAARVGMEGSASGGASGQAGLQRTAARAAAGPTHTRVRQPSTPSYAPLCSTPEHLNIVVLSPVSKSCKNCGWLLMILAPRYGSRGLASKKVTVPSSPSAARSCARGCHVGGGQEAASAGGQRTSACRARCRRHTRHPPPHARRWAARAVRHTSSACLCRWCAK